jgi:hypothetical protein
VRTVNRGVVDPKQSGEEQIKELVEEHIDRKIWEFSGFLVAGNSAERGVTKQKTFHLGQKRNFTCGYTGYTKTLVQSSRSPIKV